MIKSTQRKTESEPDHMNFRPLCLICHRTLTQLLGTGINFVLVEPHNFPDTAFMKKLDLTLCFFEKDNMTVYHYLLFYCGNYENWDSSKS